jgi:microcystin-dependent protein
MSSPYVGQIIMFAGDFAPAGWALCQGQVLSIAENQALFNLIGTTYGGDGESTFALPDMRGRVPISQGQGQRLSNYALGQQVGVEAVTLTPGQLANHGHPVLAVNQPGNANVPSDNVLLAALGGQAGSGNFQVFAYAPPGAQTQLNANTVGTTGGSQPHGNVQPYLSLNYCIALTGTYPSPA